MASTVARVLVALLVVAALLSAVPARAARPLDTEDTDTVPAGSAEVELGVEHTRDGENLRSAARGAPFVAPVHARQLARVGSRRSAMRLRIISSVPPPMANMRASRTMRSSGSERP